MLILKEENLYDDLPYFVGSDIQKEINGDIWEVCSLSPSFSLRNNPHQLHWDFSVNMMTGEINYSGKPFNLDTSYPKEVLAFMKKELPRMKPFIIRDNFQHIALVNGKWSTLNWTKRYPNDWNGR